MAEQARRAHQMGGAGRWLDGTGHTAVAAHVCLSDPLIARFGCKASTPGRIVR
jgi:hypothetical protein